MIDFSLGMKITVRYAIVIIVVVVLAIKADFDCAVSIIVNGMSATIQKKDIVISFIIVTTLTSSFGCGGRPILAAINVSFNVVR